MSIESLHCLFFAAFIVAAPVSSQTLCGQEPASQTAVELSEEKAWRSLFDGKSLQGWQVTQFGGEGDVYVEDKALQLEFGAPLTGVTSTHDRLPKTNYELRLQAQRLDGTDFFCGLTFPVGDSHCSFIAGGWGGALVGLSSIDGQDASENQTRLSRAFRQKTWYTFRVRVEPDRIQVWIDDERVIDQNIEGREISLRPEVDLCRPLGICAFDTRAAIRQVELRTLE